MPYTREPEHGQGMLKNTAVTTHTCERRYGLPSVLGTYKYAASTTHTSARKYGWPIEPVS